MGTTITVGARFDGSVLVPDERLDLPQDEHVTVRIETGPESVGALLLRIAENAVVDDFPVDLAADHDHYLYGSPRLGHA